MNPLEQAVIDLVRLGLRGDALSVRQMARRLLRQLPKQSPVSDDFRSTLTGALVAREASFVTRTVRPSDAPVDSDSFSELLQREYTGAPEIPFLENAEAEAIELLIMERERVAQLSQAGLEPSKTILFVGPPGVGKTMSARFVAGRLGLPLFRMDLGATISSFLGKTGQNLQRSLKYARSQPGVLLLDEFDAIAKRRDDASDIGELKRIVNVLLLELESWPETGVLIAATNHPELLDRAVWRRFDRVIEFSLPSMFTRRTILAAAFRQYGLNLDPGYVDIAAFGMYGASGSDLHRMAREAARNVVLTTGESADAMILNLTLKHLTAAADSDEARARFCKLANWYGGQTQRAIGQQLNVSHVTVGKLIKRTLDEQDILPPRNPLPRGRAS